MKFKCPTCKSTRLEEVMVDVTVASTINDVDEGSIDYGEQSNEDGVVQNYQCLSCGESIKASDEGLIDNSDDLYEWLKERNML